MTTPSNAVQAFWQAFKQSTGHSGDDYEALSCGDSPALQTELAGLIVEGRKRATAGLLRDFTEGGEKMPAVGDLVIVLDGAGVPRCIWQTTEVTVKPLNQVVVAFAWDEGEGDRTRDWWLRAHHAFFERSFDTRGWAFHPDIEVAFERFEVVWTGEPPG